MYTYLVCTTTLFCAGGRNPLLFFVGDLVSTLFGPKLVCVVCFGALENPVEAPGGIASAFPVILDDGRVS